MFLDADKQRGQEDEALAGASIPSVRYMATLWLAADHIHVYFESDGEKSADFVIHRLKKISEEGLLKCVPAAVGKLGVGGTLWADDYFVQTVG